MENLKAFLGSIEEFKDLDDESLERLATGATTEQFNEGDVILSQGVEGENIWVILWGSVKVVQERRNGEHVLLAALGPNNIIGEISVLTKGPTNAEVVAKERCTAVKIPGENLSRLIEHNIATMGRFTKSIVSRLSNSSRK